MAARKDISSQAAAASKDSNTKKSWSPHLDKEKDYEALREIFKHHIDSFDYMVEHGFEKMMLGLKPVECRQANLTYAGKFMVDIKYQYDEGVVIRDRVSLGQFPIMLKSKYCHLKDANTKKLVSLKEEPSEMGG
ncbi:hypothetical protein MIMGU_mgv1a0004242mg, partial [Erythranthe guttata]